MQKPALLFLLLPLLQQCAPKDPGIQTSSYHAASPVASLDGVKIPVMRSFELDKKWGSPEIIVLKNGGYSLRYTKPGKRFETLRIYGMPGRLESDAAEPPTYTDVEFGHPTKEPTTIEVSQKWRTIPLLGRAIHYYLLTSGGGADAPEYSTVTFSPTKPGEPIASYRLIATSNEENWQEMVEVYFKTVGF